MIEKLKAYCERELHWYSTTTANIIFDPHDLTTRCYGALMFVLSELDVYDTKELGLWWDDEMLPKLRKFEDEYYQRKLK